MFSPMLIDSGAGAAGAGWPTVSAASRVLWGGIAAASHVEDNSLSGGVVTGRTFLCTLVTQRLLQDGYVRRVKLLASALGVAGDIKFKVMRISGLNYVMISESETINVAVSGAKIYNLATPMLARPGDLLACWIVANGMRICANFTAGDVHYINDVDVTTTRAIADFSVVAGQSMSLEFQGREPLSGFSSDSILGGHNVAAAPGQWRTLLDTDGPSGVITAEPFHQMRGLFLPGRDVDYRNYARGAQEYSWVRSTGLPPLVAINPKIIVTGAGILDVINGRTWVQVVADLDAMLLTIPADAEWFLSEILPYTGGSDANAVTIRTFNTNIAAWCITNGAHLIACHDAMGQIRGTTGFLDNLLAAYDLDGIHLTQAGVDAFAALIKAALVTYYGA